VICLDPTLLHADCTRAANVRSGNLMLSYRVQTRTSRPSTWSQASTRPGAPHLLTRSSAMQLVVHGRELGGRI